MEQAKLKFKLRKLVRELSSYRARHTELVSVYISPGYDIVKVQQQLAQEAGTARNIKSASTRKNVQDALQKMIGQLRLYKKTPPNGLATFSGNVGSEESGSDVKVWSIEPPLPLKNRLYRCGQTFFLDPLIELTVPKEAYGLVVIDRSEGTIAILKGKAIIPVVNFHSMVPGKTRAGGQSAPRFARVRENLAKDFFKKVGDAVNKELSGKRFKGIILGGPGPIKETFADGNYLSNEIKEKIIARLDIGYTGDAGIEELVNRSKDILAREDIVAEKQVVNKFMTKLSTQPDQVAYGIDPVRKAIEAGAVEMLLLSEELDDKTIEELAEKVEKFGGLWALISKDTKEGQLLINLGKIGATLRFKVE